MQAFFATLRMSLAESGYFGVMNTVGEYLLKYLRMLPMLLVWTSLFAAAGASSGVPAQDAVIDGMRLEQMLSYTLLASAFAPLLSIRTAISSWLHDGQILSLYRRPMGVLRQLVAMTLGGMAPHLLLVGLPCIAILAPALGLSFGTRLPLALLSLLLTVIQGFAVDFLFACLIVRSGNLSYQVDSLRNALTALFTGSVIPFAALPFGIGAFLSLTPLGTLAGAPLSIATGLASPAPILIAQVLWTALLCPLAAHLFSRSLERMVSYGG